MPRYFLTCSDPATRSNSKQGLPSLIISLLLLNLVDTPTHAYDYKQPPLADTHRMVHICLVPAPSMPTLPAAFPSLSISDANLPGLPEYRSQDQQVNAALPLGGSIRGKWRVREERGPEMSADGRTARACTSTVVFRGFIEEPYRGVVDYDPGSCGEGGTGLVWVSKTTRVVQLTARWKVRLPEGKFIYKGFIDAGRVVGKSGSVDAEMTGLILTGEDSNNRVVGKFSADLIKSYDSSDIKIGGATSDQMRTISLESK